MSFIVSHSPPPDPHPAYTGTCKRTHSFMKKNPLSHFWKLIGNPIFAGNQPVSAEWSLTLGHLSLSKPCCVFSSHGSPRGTLLKLWCTPNSTFTGLLESQLGFFTEGVTFNVKLFSSLRHCNKLCFSTMT